MSTLSSIPSGLIPALEYTRVSPRPKHVTERMAKSGEIIHDPRESIPIQHRRNDGYAAQWGFHLAFRFEDPDSSATVPLRDREVGRQMLECLRLNKIKHLIVQRIDRLFRDTMDGLAMAEYFAERKIAMHFSDEGGNSINTATARGKMFFTMALAECAYARDITAERTSQAQLDYVRQGRLVGAEAAYGKMIDPADPKRTVINPDEAPVIQAILSLDGEGKGTHQIAAILDSTGAPCRGKKWRARSVRKILERARADAALRDYSNPYAPH